MPVAGPTDDPLPLHRQAADEIRYRIATGRIAPGDRLPSLRELAGELHVHLHTVRKACHALQQQGLLEIRQGSGMFVRVERAPADPRLLERIVGSALHQAVGLGFSASEFAAAARRAADPASAPAEAGTVFVECNVEQAEAHARELTEALGQAVRPVLLADLAQEAGGTRIVTTYFHYHELVAARPSAPVLPVIIRLDGEVLRRIARYAPGERLAVLCRDRESLRAILAQIHGGNPAVTLEGFALPALARLRRELPACRALVYMPPCRKHAAELDHPEKIELVHRIEPGSMAEVKEKLRQIQGR